jgi:hypothetical protein
LAEWQLMAKSVVPEANTGTEDDVAACAGDALTVIAQPIARTITDRGARLVATGRGGDPVLSIEVRRARRAIEVFLMRAPSGTSTMWGARLEGRAYLARNVDSQRAT